jgi:hypothetical protein
LAVLKKRLLTSVGFALKYGLAVEGIAAVAVKRRFAFFYIWKNNMDKTFND